MTDAPQSSTQPTAREAVGASLRLDRQRLLDDGPPPGPLWCAAWTEVVDAACRALHESSGLGDALTIVAVGGYGRSQLCPQSDVDLMLLHDGLERDEVEQAARAVFHPLWDAGLKLGHAIRAADEVVGDALDELDTTTAVLDGRVVAGPTARFDEAHAALLAKLEKRPKRFLDLLAAADAERRQRAGDAAEQLEPDLKSGAGGLRDVQSLRWAAAAVTGTVDLGALQEPGHVGEADPSRIDAAEAELVRLRVALHLVTDQPVDVLRMEHQQAVAELLGEVDGDDDRDTAAHRALARHFAAARVVEHTHDRAWRKLDGTASRFGFPRRRPQVIDVAGLEVTEGLVVLPDAADPLDPTLPARLIRALLSHDNVLERATASRLRRVAADVDVPAPWGPELRSAWLAMLRSHDGPRVQAELDDIGWLVALVPEWEPQRCRPQRNPFHLYSLDRHLVHAAHELALLPDREPWAAAALAHVDLPDALVVGTWLHDVGKILGEPHSLTGIEPARTIATRIGLTPEEVERVGVLVEHHLLLPEHGTRRDVSDPAEAVAVAEIVGDVGLLCSLHLLSAADGLATGPTAWTPWKASLVSVLVTKVTAVLADHDPTALADGAPATADAAAELGPSLGVDADVVRTHLAQLPERYAAAVSPRAVVRHAGLAAQPCAPGEVRTRVTPTEVEGDGETAYDELDVVALDTPGLFTKVAGVIALHGGSILEAHAHTREDGTAVDTLTVVVPEHATGSWWVMVEGDLAEAVAGRLAVRARVARKRAGERRRLAKLPEVATTVQISQDAAGRATLVEVRTMDRIGVLYRISSALAELELDMVVAKVATEGHEAVDVFSVRDASGQPLDEDHCRELELAITAALAE